MSYSVNVTTSFWSVGQGLFSSGYIGETYAPDFTWIYDCGNSGNSDVRDSSINKFRDNIEQKPLIDLLVISHFDEDHINGLELLLKNIEVNTLLLPLVPLWQRILFLFKEKVPLTSPSADFFIDPINFIYRLAEHKLGRVILVPPSNNISDNERDSISDLLNPEDWRDERIFESNYLEQEAEQFPNTFPRNRIFILRKRVPLRVNRVWEFRPYNDSSLVPVSPTFELFVNTERQNILSGPGSNRDGAIGRLKSFYDSHHIGGEARNEISLFLYGGPVGRVQQAAGNPYILVSYNSSHEQTGHVIKHNAVAPSKRSILYSGDGYLTSPEKLKEIETFLNVGPLRDKLVIFQVMHHGSRHNSFSGVADFLNPEFSIFSSDPGFRNYKHPHSAVVNQFKYHNPVYVDRNRGCSIIFPVKY